jgi:hypothetical protein
MSVTANAIKCYINIQWDERQKVIQKGELCYFLAVREFFFMVS